MVLAMCDVYVRRRQTLDAALVPLVALMLAAVYTRIVAIVLLPAPTLALWMRGQPRMCSLTRRTSIATCSLCCRCSMFTSSVG